MPRKGDLIYCRLIRGIDRLRNMGNRIVEIVSPKTIDFLSLYDLFHQQLWRGIKHKLVPTSVFGVGINGKIVRNHHPLLFFKPEVLADLELRSIADGVMPSLLKAAYANDFRPDLDIRHRSVLVGLIGYLLWKGRDMEILNLASSLRQHSVHEEEIEQLSTLLEIHAGYSSWTRHLTGQFAIVGAWLTQPSNLSAQEDVWSRWVSGAFQKNPEIERQSILNIVLAHESRDDLLNLYQWLLLRGRLFLATRLLLKGPFAWEGWAQREVLHIYYENLKFLSYLHRIAKGKDSPASECYYETCVCIDALGLQYRMEGLLGEIFAGKTRIPSLFERQDFISKIEALRGPHLGSALLKDDLLKLSILKGKSQLQSKWIDWKDPDQIVRWSALLDQPEKWISPEIAKSLAGRIMALRSLRGREGLNSSHPSSFVRYAEQLYKMGRKDRARKILKRLLENHPEMTDLGRNLSFLEKSLNS